MTFLTPEHFDVLAGHDVVESIRASRAAVRGDDDLCARQRADARRGVLGVEVCKTLKGYSVRYDSGLQNWGLVARSLPTFDDAAEVARQWATADPAHRYAWVRRSAL
jgi:hypothetical protein